MAMEEKQFQTEVSQLLDIMIHSLYSNKEIFLRELISNASDAIDKARYEGLTNASLFEGGTDWKIKMNIDVNEGTLTVSDNGIGMTKEEAVSLLGTIANSGTKEFVKKLAENKNLSDAGTLIGQFGVGFYSSFMVSDHVTVITRKRGETADKAVKWQSDAKSTFTVEDAVKDTPGSDVILKLREEDKGLLNEYALRRIVTTYSDYIEYPVVMDVSKPVMDSEGKATGATNIVEETLNSMKALWLKDKSEVSQEEADQFYQHISHDFAPPAKVVQFKAEGTSEFHALLFIPSHAPFDLFNKEMKYGPMLYVKRVLIMEHCEELIPQYLRFVQGVVDSSDLPLNISREILQNNRQIEVMQKNITRKIVEALEQLKQNEPDTYKKFYEEFGKVLKEGVYYDMERRETLAKLLLFESTATPAGVYTTLPEYVSRMKAEQKDIYFITGGSRKELENSVYLEGLKAKNFEVLFMTDDFDDIVFTSLGVFDGKPMKSILKGDLELDDEVKARKAKSYEGLIGAVKTALGNKVVDVRLTTRLKKSPVVLVTNEGAPDPYMERMLKAMGQPVPEAKRTLELNPDHTLVKAMKKATDNEENKKVIDEYAELLYDQAVILEGGKIDDTAGFIKKMSKLMEDKLKQDNNEE